MKIRFDQATLSGLREVSVEPDPQTTHAKKQSLNEQYIVISLFQDTKTESDDLLVSKTVDNCTVYKVREMLSAQDRENPQRYTACILKIISDHFERNGVIKEVRIIGHGSGGKMWASNKSSLDINRLLDDLAFNEGFHGKIVNRIVFDGCNTFSRIPDKVIEYYSKYAQTHSTEIVGTTSIIDVGSTMFGKHIRTGRYVLFSPQGQILRDKLDTRFDPNVLFLDNDRSWTDFYIGRTFQEGHAIKTAYESKQAHKSKPQLSR